MHTACKHQLIVAVRLLMQHMLSWRPTCAAPVVASLHRDVYL